jgi:hypothetical protein
MLVVSANPFSQTVFGSDMSNSGHQLRVMIVMGGKGFALQLLLRSFYDILAYTSRKTLESLSYVADQAVRYRSRTAMRDSMGCLMGCLQ